MEDGQRARDGPCCEVRNGGRKAIDEDDQGDAADHRYDDARPLRILAEYMEPLDRLRKEHIHDTIVFFGSARLLPDGPMGRYYKEAQELAR